jgi:hypothetical protein
MKTSVRQNAAPKQKRGAHGQDTRAVVAGRVASRGGSVRTSVQGATSVPAIAARSALLDCTLKSGLDERSVRDQQHAH